ncbi:MAG: M20/M25/M40 family metallo-hydrolase, partial [Halobacteriales archaeon]
QQAHGSMAHDGRNAVLALNDFLSRMREYRETLNDRVTELPVTPEASKRADVSPTMVEGGYSENIVPDRAAATFYRTVLPDETIEQARSEIRELIGDSERATAADRFEYEEIMYAEPTQVDADCEVANVFESRILDFFSDTAPVYSPGSDDQRFVVNDGGVDQCIVYGPGLLEQAHVADEYVPVSELRTATKVMAASTADLMGAL